MGYTHYWRISRDLTPAEWELFIEVVRDIFKDEMTNGIRLTGWDCTGKPLADGTEVAFNAADGLESVNITRVRRELKGWELEFGPEERGFCKTDRRPYDRAVRRVLAALADIASDAIGLGTDDSVGLDVFKFA